MIGKDRFGAGYSKIGRGNISPITVVLPKIAIEYGIATGKRTEADITGFFTKLDEILRIAEKGLVERFAHISSQSPESAKFMYQNGCVLDADKCQNNVYEALKHGTNAIGLIGLSETLYALVGKNHLDPVARELGKKIIKYIYDFAKAASDRNNLNFSCYFTPAEGCCHTIMKKLKKEFGIIRNITENEFLTNSVHVPVWEKVDIFEKLEVEREFTDYGVGGEITYIEFDTSPKDNLEALESVINHAMEMNIPYLAINFPIATCNTCGHSDSAMKDTCPECEGHDIEHLARITGYLSQDVSNFNLGKKDEYYKRFKHSTITKL